MTDCTDTRRPALVAGLALLLMAVVAGLGYLVDTL